MPAELYNRPPARDGPVEALEAEFKLGSAPVVPSELCYRYNTIQYDNQLFLPKKECERLPGHVPHWSGLMPGPEVLYSG